MVRRRADVRPDGLLDECVVVVAQFGVEQRLDRRTDAVDDRVQVPRLAGRGPGEFLEGRVDRTAVGVAEHDDELRVEPRRRELHAADLRRRDDVARDADDEEIAESLVEDEFGRHPGIGTAEDDREGRLAGRQFESTGLGDRAFAAGDFGDEPEVALAQALKGFVGRDHGSWGRVWSCRQRHAGATAGAVESTRAGLPAEPDGTTAAVRNHARVA